MSARVADGEPDERRHARYREYFAVSPDHLRAPAVQRQVELAPGAVEEPPAQLAGGPLACASSGSGPVGSA